MSAIRTLSGQVMGGTGRVHDWALSRRIIEAVPCPVFLAGGLCPDNVGAAIATVRPFGVDVCTGVRRADYSLDPNKLAAFVAAVAAAAEIG
jgi:phosphoribosylanthranilate isomerase